MNLLLRTCYNISMWLSFVQLLSRVWLFATQWTAAWQASLSFTNSWSLLKTYPLSCWCHPTISSSVIPFSFCFQSFPASGSFPVSLLFVSGGQSIAASASALVLPMYIQGWFPLGLAALISLLYKGERSQIFNYPGVCSTPCQTMSWKPASELVAANSQTFDSNIFALT